MAVCRRFEGDADPDGLCKELLVPLVEPKEDPVALATALCDTETDPDELLDI